MGKSSQTEGKSKGKIAFLGATIVLALLIFSGCSAEQTSTTVSNDTDEENVQAAPVNSENSEPDKEGESNTAAGTTEVVTYESHVKDIITKNCLACHGDQSPTMAEFDVDPDKYAAMSKGPRLSDYENLLVVVNGTDAGAVMRRLDDGTNTKDGQPGNMYQNLGATEEERQQNLAVLKEWVGHWSLKKAAELTDEERALFKVYENSESVPKEASPVETSGEVTYESHVKDIIAQNCLACHGDQSPTMAEFDVDPDKYAAMSKGPRLSDYENLLVVVNGTDAGAVMRRLDDGTNTKDGQPGNMYQNLGSTEEERQQNLAILKEWVGHWSLKKAAELTDEDRAKFKVLEK